MPISIDIACKNSVVLNASKQLDASKNISLLELFGASIYH